MKPITIDDLKAFEKWRDDRLKKDIKDYEKRYGKIVSLGQLASISIVPDTLSEFIAWWESREV